MREFNTAPLEVRKEILEDFQTHPFECGWASEAIFFISVEDVSGKGAMLDATVQISNDGVFWTDEGTCFVSMAEKGLTFVRVGHFGGWLRLNCSVSGTDARFRLNIQLALKE
ncbi:MAG: hypothetical protein DRP71_11785 [Verrucomicrobia bacterium]|nr:MAG: hypothetical protein DRP71_11785 [Verrucomicrobiota bacterium]